MITSPHELWPTVNILKNGRPVVVDSFIMVFFLERAACADPRPAAGAFSAFIKGPGRGKLHFHVDRNGDLAPLPPDPMDLVAERIVSATEEGSLAGLTLYDTDEWGYRYEAKYLHDPDVSPKWPDERSFIWFRVAQDRVLEDGLDQVVSFMRYLADILPYSYGYASPALAYSEHISETHQVIHRRPGFDIADPAACAADIDGRPLGAYWLSVFSRQLTDDLGGAMSLASRIPEATVSTAGQGGTLLLLGDAPSVGDVNRGDNLPLYRKLARLLEPMLRVPRIIYMRDPDNSPSPEAQEAWHSRFLTP